MSKRDMDLDALVAVDFAPWLALAEHTRSPGFETLIHSIVAGAVWRLWQMVLGSAMQ